MKEKKKKLMRRIVHKKRKKSTEEKESADFLLKAEALGFHEGKFLFGHQMMEELNMH